MHLSFHFKCLLGIQPPEQLTLSLRGPWRVLAWSVRGTGHVGVKGYFMDKGPAALGRGQAACDMPGARGPGGEGGVQPGMQTEESDFCSVGGREAEGFLAGE